ncbi:glycosyltransferase family 2 protein [Janthinobacterium sp. 17J80-10]|uniref:glycosyltransferase family 2 protein n=1 Tax=Janthinobacterium sp. 17J80-10 TaxID=2497863 RepID=UPI0010053C0F|nr:glycosyltransferase family 2 protein [Janthinobacterium sp. 17J80-10]QAU33634.1 glycosyltransferase family 2 protein [Janthinobacterium sp. 17J80-10]
MQPIQPLVSVIIPTFNRGNLIARALHSVLRQTYQNLEVIVVDDGSTDDTEAVVAAIGDQRIRYLRSSTRLGAAAARNIGIAEARGNFISFQDSDDEWLCQKLEKQMDAFLSAGEDVGVVFSGFFRLQGNRANYFPAKAQQRKNGHILDVLLYENFITTQSTVVRKECFSAVGAFDEKMPRLQDWELFIRIAKKYKFICIQEPLLCAFHSSESITADKTLLPLAFRRILTNHFELYSQRKYQLAHFYVMMGKAAWEAGGILDGYLNFLSSLRIAPFSLQNWRQILSVTLGSVWLKIKQNRAISAGRHV